MKGLRIGRFRLGFAPLSMISVFIILTVIAIISAFRQVSPECPMPLSGYIFVNESLALAGTLVCGVALHFIQVIISKI